MSSRVRCKICGIKDFPTAQLAAQIGADFIGLHAIWQVKPEELPTFRRIVREMPKRYGGTQAVIVTRQTNIHTVIEMIKQVNPPYVQLHASWSRSSIIVLRNELSKEGYSGVRLIGVVALENEDSLQLVKQISGAVDLLLLDSSVRGGTGRTVAFTLLQEAMILAASTPVLIAGGLTPENVVSCIRVLHPFGVDVQTGVEYPDQPGVKDPKRVAAFLEAVKRVRANIANL